jgi:hypothetical protein
MVPRVFPQLFTPIERLLECKEETTMTIERIFTGTANFMSLMAQLLEKEIEKMVNAAYNNTQVDIVAAKNGGDKE